MKLCSMLIAAACLGAIVSAQAHAADAAAQDEEKELAPALNFDMKTLDGEEVNLAKEYQGKVVLLVNVASKCGNTPQYKPLEALHEKYGKAGLAIVGVPSNQFGGQEPGTAEEIAEFCEATYGVEFDLLSKANVRDDQPEQAPLYKYLTSKETNPEFAGNVTWNFEKFLFDRHGNVVARFSPRTQPDSPEVLEAIQKALAEKL